MRQVRVLILVLMCGWAGLLVIACGSPAPGGEVDDVATRVAVERAVAATLTAEALSAPTATDTTEPPTAIPGDAPTATPTLPAPTDTPAAPTATPTRISRVAREVNGGGDDVSNLRGPLDIKGGRYVVIPGFSEAELSDPVVFRDRMNLSIEISDTDIGLSDGDGIANVEFQIFDSTGLVYSHVEDNPAYCAFGGDDPRCQVLVFAQSNFTWPESDLPDRHPIRDDFHNVAINITADSGVQTGWVWSFEIQGVESPASPTFLTLRPACGTTLDVPANQPITLRYGIWANRGLDRAAANEDSIQIELTVDGLTVGGLRVLPPVATIEGAICGRDYEDSYWVYHVVTLDSLSPGSHAVQVTYRFQQPVDDGYGTVYTQPFSQRYTITAR